MSHLSGTLIGSENPSSTTLNPSSFRSIVASPSHMQAELAIVRHSHDHDGLDGLWLETSYVGAQFTDSLAPLPPSTLDLEDLLQPCPTATPPNAIQHAPLAPATATTVRDWLAPNCSAAPTSASLPPRICFLIESLLGCKMSSGNNALFAWAIGHFDTLSLCEFVGVQWALGQMEKEAQ